MNSHAFQTTLARVYLYIWHKITTAAVYGSHHVPELKVEGYVLFSSHEVRCKSCMHARFAYSAWLHECARLHAICVLFQS